MKFLFKTGALIFMALLLTVVGIALGQEPSSLPAGISAGGVATEVVGDIPVLDAGAVLIDTGDGAGSPAYETSIVPSLRPVGGGGGFIEGGFIPNEGSIALSSFDRGAVTPVTIDAVGPMLVAGAVN